MSSTSETPSLSPPQIAVLLISITIVAVCGIVYELIIGTVSSYLLGNSVYQFSLTIGFFMFAMGVGSLISKYFSNLYVRNFILVEIFIALLGGICSILLFMAFPYARVLYEFVMIWSIQVPLTSKGLVQKWIRFLNPYSRHLSKSFSVLALSSSRTLIFVSPRT